MSPPNSLNNPGFLLAELCHILINACTILAESFHYLTHLLILTSYWLNYVTHSISLWSWLYWIIHISISPSSSHFFLLFKHESKFFVHPALGVQTAQSQSKLVVIIISFVMRVNFALLYLCSSPNVEFCFGWKSVNQDFKFFCHQTKLKRKDWTYCCIPYIPI